MVKLFYFYRAAGLTGILFMLGCFNAPMPEYVRPGHPEWPVSWLGPQTMLTLDERLSLPSDLIDCVPVFLSDSIGNGSKLLDVCGSEGKKLYLAFHSTVNPDEITGQYLRAELIKWSDAAGGHFPLHCIPAMLIPSKIVIPCDSLQNIIGEEAPDLLLISEGNYPLLHHENCTFNGVIKETDGENPVHETVSRPSDWVDILRVNAVFSGEIDMLSVDALLWETESCVQLDASVREQIRQKRLKMKMGSPAEQP